MGFVLGARTLNDMLRHGKSVLIRDKPHTLALGSKVFFFEQGKRDATNNYLICEGFAAWDGSHTLDTAALSECSSSVAANEFSETALLRDSMRKFAVAGRSTADDSQDTIAFRFSHIQQLSSDDCLHVTPQKTRLGWFKFTDSDVRSDCRNLAVRLASWSSSSSSFSTRAAEATSAATSRDTSEDGRRLTTDPYVQAEENLDEMVSASAVEGPPVAAAGPPAPVPPPASPTLSPEPEPDARAEDVGQALLTYEETAIDSAGDPACKRLRVGSGDDVDAQGAESRSDESDESLGTVRCLGDVFTWPDHGLNRAEAALSKDAASMIAARLATDSMATAFSGIDAPGTARTMLHRRLQERLGRKLPLAPHEWAIDRDGDSRRELEVHPDGPDHIFGEITEFWQPAVAAALKHMKARGEKVTFHKLLGMVKTRKSVKTSAWCYRHQKQCHITRTRLICAGPPCVGFSSIGKQLKDEDESMEATMCWFAILLLLLIPVCFHENVLQMERALIAAVVAAFYDIHECPMYPEDYGVPCRRPRMYRLLVLKEACTGILFPFNRVPEIFARKCAVDFRIFLFASEDELEEELKWASNRPRSLATDGLTLAEPDSFRKALTAHEADSLANYLRTYPNSSKVFSLKQTVASDHAVVSSDALQTVTKNVGLLWDSSVNRWFLSKELLASQGFPVPGSVGHGFPLCSSYQVARQSPRSRQATSERAGNSMNVNCCGYMHIYRLLAIDLVSHSIAAIAGSLSSPSSLR